MALALGNPETTSLLNTMTIISLGEEYVVDPSIWPRTDSLKRFACIYPSRISALSFKDLIYTILAENYKENDINALTWGLVLMVNANHSPQWKSGSGLLWVYQYIVWYIVSST